MLIKHAKIIVSKNECEIKDILIQDGKIIAIDDEIISSDSNILDANYQLVMPGGIDVHVHLREPGFETKETIYTGTLAALRGGYTTIMAMPNVKPFPDCVEVIKPYLELIKKEAMCHVVPYGCITQSEKGHELVDMHAIKQLGISAFSDDGVGIQSDEVMLKAMQLAKKEDVMIVAHTEDMKYRKPNACIHDGSKAQQLQLVGIPSECEYEQAKRDLEMALITKAKYHICHISTKETVELLRQYKQLGADVSGEVTTHHLLLTEDDVKDANTKMNPPLRSKEDQEALLQGLLDGTIDMIANDHAPHTIVEKKQSLEKAPFGVVALETSIPLIYTYFVKKKIISLEKFQAIISSNPAKRFGFYSKGSLAIGKDADLICIEEEENIINKDQFVSLGKNTPFDGWKVSANIAWSMIAGKIKQEERS